MLRLPVETTLAADRRHQAVGEVEPDPGGRQQHDQRDDSEHQRERDLDAEPAGLQVGEFADIGLRRTQLRHYARVEQARDIEVHAVVAAQLDGGGDVVALGDERDLRPVLVGLAEHGRRRQHDLLLHLDVGLLDRAAVLGDHHGGGEAADLGLPGQELAEPLAVLVEQRLGAPDVECHGQNLGADILRMLGDVGIGHDQRLLDHGAGARGEEAVEAAVERRARHHGDQHRRHRSHHAEQADDAHMQARAGPSAPARLDHLPDFAPDDGEQQHAGRRIAHQQRDHDLVDRRDRGQPRQHQKCCHRR
jgi:hypothetical protein